MFQAVETTMRFAPEDRPGSAGSSFDIDEGCRACARNLPARAARPPWPTGRNADPPLPGHETPDRWFLRYLVPIVTLAFWSLIVVVMI